MAGRTQHTPKQIIRKLRQGDELAATGTDVEDIARQLDVSGPTLYNWRKLLRRNRNRRCQRVQGIGERQCPAQEAHRRSRTRKGCTQGDREGKNMSPTAKRNAVTMLQKTMGSHSVSRAKSSGNRDRLNGPRLRKTPDNPNSDLWKWLRD